MHLSTVEVGLGLTGTLTLARLTHPTMHAETRQK
jgi:hypothetical protein